MFDMNFVRKNGLDVKEIHKVSRENMMKEFGIVKVVDHPGQMLFGFMEDGK